MRPSNRSARIAALMASVAGASLFASASFAQDSGDQLEQVVVTATRQADTVNRVPLAVTAQTQRNLDQQGVRTVRDLEALVPSLNTTQTLASGASQFSVRGVGFLGNNPAGAAPVGFYLDDTALQKRNVGGGVATSNGTPLPPLFDLERVEVLRGPQGTLFGGGSEGGTIRYIQPAPSLTRYSTYARGQVSHVEDGGTSYEAGVAVGGPIIQDKLGFRASVFARNQAGFVDLIDPLTKQEWAHNSGGQAKVRMMRGALAWAPTDRSKITVDFFSSVDKSRDLATSYTMDLPNAVVIPTSCFNANNTPSGLSGFTLTPQGYIGTNTAPRVGPIGSQPTTPVGAVRSNPNPVARGDAACAAAVARGDVTYTLPGFTYGPYDLEKYDSVTTNRSPSKTNLQIGSLTIDYDFGSMSMKAITSYIDDQTKTVTGQTGPNQTGLRSGFVYNDPTLGLLGSQISGPGFNAIWGPTSADVTGYFVSNNRRYGLTQEIRFSSNGSETKRLSWVGGVYYANIRGKAQYDNYQPLAYWARTLYGLTQLQRYGLPGIETAPGLFNNYDAKRQRLKDVEIAAFAEANYWLIPDKLRATAGVRLSRVSFDYEQSFIGPVSSVGPGNGLSATGVSFATPSSQNGGYNSGSTAESPVTPKFGLQYQLSPNDMIYVAAAKGFRAGGVNSQVSYGICQLGLDRYGYLPADLPQEYSSDSVWSYEGGTKLRLLNGRAQFNAAVYRIDWTDPQYTTPPPQCGLVTTFNAPSARSQGVELEAQARVFTGLTLNGSFGYTDAKYTGDLVFQGKATPANNFVVSNLVLVRDGQPIPVPKYSFTIGARFDAPITDTVRAYVRGDWRHQSAYKTAPPYPASTFTLDSYSQRVDTANFRVGVEYGDFDINAFVNNAFDRDKGLIGGGRASCLDAACTSFQGYNPLRTVNTGLPREFGLQIAYRH